MHLHVASIDSYGSQEIREMGLIHEGIQKYVEDATVLFHVLNYCDTVWSLLEQREKMPSRGSITIFLPSCFQMMLDLDAARSRQSD